MVKTDKKFILVPQKDSWDLEDGSLSLNIFWMQGCPDVVLEQIFEKKLGFIPRKGDIDALRYPKQYEITVTERDKNE
jgi:hypothetical protein